VSAWDGRWLADQLDLWHHVGLIDRRRYLYDAHYKARWYRLGVIAANSHQAAHR
jgi:hypothetical protein